MISGRRSAKNGGEKTLNSRLLPSRRRPQERVEPFSWEEAEALPLLLNPHLRSRYQNAQVSSELTTSRGGSCLREGRVEGMPLSISPLPLSLSPQWNPRGLSIPAQRL